MKQTAVKFFEDELKDKLGTIVINKNWELLEKIIEQAKEMENEQIVKTFTNATVATLQNLNIKSTIQDILDFKKNCRSLLQ